MMSKATGVRIEDIEIFSWEDSESESSDSEDDVRDVPTFKDP